MQIQLRAFIAGASEASAPEAAIAAFRSSNSHPKDFANTLGAAAASGINTSNRENSSGLADMAQTLDRS
jgi:hypothetical protein